MFATIMRTISFSLVLLVAELGYSADTHNYTSGDVHKDTSNGSTIGNSISDTGATISNLTEVDWTYHFTATDSSIAMIDQDRMTLHIYRLGSDEIKVPVKTGWLFFLVRFVTPNLLITGEFPELMPGDFRWTGRDLSGRVVSGPVFSSSLMTITPDGRFFYAVSDPGSEHNRPAILDSEGETVGKFEPSSGDWDMQYLHDGRLMWRDKGAISLFTLPVLTDTVVCPAVDVLPGYLMRASVSSDGSHYVFTAHEQVVACDLINCTIVSSDMSRCAQLIPSAYPLVSDSGRVVMVQAVPDIGYEASFCMGWGADAEADVHVVDIPLDQAYMYDRDNSFICGQYCVLNFFRNEEAILAYRAAIVPLTISATAAEPLSTFDGLVLPGETPTEFTLITLAHRKAHFRSISVEKGVQ